MISVRIPERRLLAFAAVIGLFAVGCPTGDTVTGPMATATPVPATATPVPTAAPTPTPALAELTGVVTIPGWPPDRTLQGAVTIQVQGLGPTQVGRTLSNGTYDITGIVPGPVQINAVTIAGGWRPYNASTILGPGVTA